VARVLPAIAAAAAAAAAASWCEVLVLRLQGWGELPVGLRKAATAAAASTAMAEVLLVGSSSGATSNRRFRSVI
jgi:hypothetical protein